MRIVDLLKEEAIKLKSSVGTKAEAIDELISLHENAGNLEDVEVYRQGILAREEQGTTAIGEGIAIPHAKSKGVKNPGLAVITSEKGVDYGAPDGENSRLIFMIAAPTDGDLHLEVLSKLMTLLMDLDLRKKLLDATSSREFLSMLDEAQRKRFPEEEKQEARADVDPGNQEVQKTSNGAAENLGKKSYRVVAVTACPTGIAHTYMAAEALTKAGEEMGVSIKVETNGSSGAKNLLTPEEIEKAEAVIIAADKTVSMSRFDGKKLIKTGVAKGINEPKALIEKALNDDLPLYSHQGEKDSKAAGDNEGYGRQIYKHLMNGVSYMLPFVIGGGILIALAFLVDSLAGVPRDGEFGSHTELAAFFMTVGKAAFNFMLPVLAGYIAKSIADRPGLAVGFAGGYLATIGTTFANLGGDSSAVSGFLGALLAGFVGGYIVLGLKKAFNWLPRSIENMLPILIMPLFGIAIMGAVMCAINPVVGSLNTAISDGLNSMGETSKVILGMIVAGMMAVDMGGPFNKAAYVFGTAALTTGGYDIMAAVMIGGMVPPIAIALAATFFKNRWTETELKSAPVNYIMGLSFITEGAIPYAAADPIRVIPSCIVGSAVSGGLSMLFNCTLQAPHGGIFVFLVVGNALMYVVSLAIGSLVGMGMLALLKKKVR